MQKKRPAGVIVIAVLQLVFALLSIYGAIQGALTNPEAASKQQLEQMQQQMQAQMQAQQQQHPGQKPIDPEQLKAIFEKRLPDIIRYNQPLEIGDLVLCLLMIASAVGLLMMKSWGRYAAILYAFLSIMWRVAYVAFMVGVFMPLFADLMTEMVQAQGQPPDAKALDTFVGIMKVMAGVFSALPGIYPLIVMVVMMSSRTARAFSDQPDESSAAPADQRDYQGPAGPADYRDQAPGAGDYR
jgi:hypothetical protein